MTLRLVAFFIHLLPKAYPSYPMATSFPLNSNYFSGHLSLDSLALDKADTQLHQEFPCMSGHTPLLYRRKQTRLLVTVHC